MRLTTSALVLFFALFTSPSFAEPMFTFADETGPNGERIATGIVDLPVMGMVFDVEFSAASLSFDDIFGTGDPPIGRVPFFDGNGNGAYAARDSMSDLYTSLTPEPTLFGTALDPTVYAPREDVPVVIALIPSLILMIPGFPVDIVGRFLALEENGGLNMSSDGTGVVRRVGNPSMSFALFEKQQVVPEPTSVVLLASLTSCCLGVRYRRRCPAAARS